MTSFLSSLFTMASALVILCISAFAFCAVAGEIWGFLLLKGWIRRHPLLIFNDAAWGWTKIGFILRGQNIRLNDIQKFCLVCAYLIWVELTAHKLGISMSLSFFVAMLPAAAATISSGKVVSRG